MKIHYSVRNTIILLLLIFSVEGFANQADLDAEKADFVSVFSSGDLGAMEAGAKKLEMSGKSDAAIFDLIEKQVLANSNTTNKNDLGSVAWLVRALGFSGNTKYTDTLNNVLKNGADKLRRHALSALKDIDIYSKVNPIINKDLDKAPAGRLGQQRALNLLHSGDYEMIGTGVKKIYKDYSNGTSADTELLDAVQKQLLSSYKTDTTNSDHQDNLAWMCKTLANSRNQNYLNAVKEVAENAESVKLKKYAAQSVANF